MKNSNKNFYNKAILKITGYSNGKYKSKTFNTINTIAIIVLIFAPIILLIALTLTDHILIGILCLVIGWSLIPIYVFLSRRYIIRKFYQVKNAHKNFIINNVEEKEELYMLYKNSAVTFFDEPSDETLNFIYNWFFYEGAVDKPDRLLNIFVYDGKKLKETFPFSRVYDDMRFMSVMLGDLNLSDKNMHSFADHHFSVGSRWLDDIINNDAPAKNRQNIILKSVYGSPQEWAKNIIKSYSHHGSIEKKYLKQLEACETWQDKEKIEKEVIPHLLR